LSKHFISSLTTQPHIVFFRLAYQSRASKQLLNSFQILIFNQKSAVPQKVPPGARARIRCATEYNYNLLKLIYYAGNVGLRVQQAHHNTGAHSALHFWGAISRTFIR